MCSHTSTLKRFDAVGCEKGIFESNVGDDPVEDLDGVRSVGLLAGLSGLYMTGLDAAAAAAGPSGILALIRFAFARSATRIGVAASGENTTLFSSPFLVVRGRFRGVS